MSIPTEPVGSVPRPAYLLEAIRGAAEGRVDGAALDAAYERAVKETIAAFEATGSPVITDGEQAKASFATYPLHGATNMCLTARSSRSRTVTRGSCRDWPPAPSSTGVRR